MTNKILDKNMIALDVHSTTKLLDWTTQSVNVKYTKTNCK